MKATKIRKVQTLEDILCHPFVERVIREYDGKNKHFVELVDGYKFDFDPTIDIGTVKELCESVNNHIVKK